MLTAEEARERQSEWWASARAQFMSERENLITSTIDEALASIKEALERAIVKQHQEITEMFDFDTLYWFVDSGVIQPSEKDRFIEEVKEGIITPLKAHGYLVEWKDYEYLSKVSIKVSFKEENKCRK